MCQLMAANCICDPVTETIWPIQSRRKSRCRRDEKAEARVASPGEDSDLLSSGIRLCIYNRQTPLIAIPPRWSSPKLISGVRVPTFSRLFCGRIEEFETGLVRQRNERRT